MLIPGHRRLGLQTFTSSYDGNIEIRLTIRTYKYFASVQDVYSHVFVTPSMKALADAMCCTFLLEQGAPLCKLILIIIMYFLVYWVHFFLLESNMWMFDVIYNGLHQMHSLSMTWLSIVWISYWHCYHNNKWKKLSLLCQSYVKKSNSWKNIVTECCSFERYDNWAKSKLVMYSFIIRKFTFQSRFQNCI